MSFKTGIFATVAIACLTIPTLAASCMSASAATFPEEKTFDQADFDAARKADKPILVHITASWCTTCAAQKPILDRLRAEPKFKNLVVYNVDFDAQKALVHKFGARMQSTLIVFKGEKEEGRSAGETSPEAIEALVDKSN